MKKILLVLFVLCLSLTKAAYAQYSLFEPFDSDKPESVEALNKITFDVDDWARLTPKIANSKGGFYFKEPIPSDKGVLIDFEFIMWGDGDLAEGLNVFFSDATVPLSSLASASSAIGFAKSVDSDGLPGGYVGVAFDANGQYSRDNYGKIGGPGERDNSISIRGATFENNPWLFGTSANVGMMTRPTDNSTTRPSDGVRRGRVELYPEGVGSRIIVSMQNSPTSEFKKHIDYLYSYPLPKNLRIGISGATGNDAQITEIRNVYISTFDNLVLSQSVSSTEIVAGSEMYFDVEVKNETTKDASNAVIKGQFPLGFKYDRFEVVSSTFENTVGQPTLSIDGHYLFPISVLKARQNTIDGESKVKIRIYGTAYSSAKSADKAKMLFKSVVETNKAMYDKDLLNNTAENIVSITYSDLSIITSIDPAFLIPNTPATLKVVVTNELTATLPSSAPTVVKVNIPTGIDVTLPIESNDWVIEKVESSLVATSNNIANVGASFSEINIPLNISENIVLSSAVFTSTVNTLNDGILTNNKSVTVADVESNSNVKILIDDKFIAYVPGNIQNYIVTVTNLGEVTTGNFDIENILPSGATIEGDVTVIENIGGQAGTIVKLADNLGFTVTAASLEGRATSTKNKISYNVPVRFAKDLTSSEVLNTVSVKNIVTDTDQTNNTSTDVNKRQEYSDIDVEVVSETTTATNCGDIEYIFKVRNNGPSVLERGYRLGFNIPKGLSLNENQGVIVLDSTAYYEGSKLDIGQEVNHTLNLNIESYATKISSSKVFVNGKENVDVNFDNNVKLTTEKALVSSMSASLALTNDSYDTVCAKSQISLSVNIVGGVAPFRVVLWNSLTGNNEYTATENSLEILDSPSDNVSYKLVSIDDANLLCANVSESQTINVLVYPEIEDNKITSTTLESICLGDMPGVIYGSIPFNGDGINYNFQWQESIDGVSFTDIVDGTTKDFYPPAIQQTTYFRRIVNSGSCVSASNVIQVIVIQTIDVSISNAEAQEGDNTITELVVTATASEVFNCHALFYISTIDDAPENTAIANEDYVPLVNKEFIWPAGQLSVNIPLYIYGDKKFEPTETFKVKITPDYPDGFNIVASEATASILNNDAMPIVTIASFANGNESDGNILFDLVLEEESYQTVVVDYVITSGTAIIGEDITAISTGSVEIPVGQLVSQISIPIVADGKYENKEDFIVQISSTTATVSPSASQSVGNIENTDPMPLLVVTDDTATDINEGESLSFSLSSAITTEVDIQAEVVAISKTAIEGQDFEAMRQVVTIPANAVSPVNVSIVTLDDNIYEPEPESTQFRVLSVKNALMPTSAVFTENIIDNDAMPLLSIEPTYSVTETGGIVELEVLVSLSTLSTVPVTVDLSTIANTAIENEDFIALNNYSLTINPGQSSASVVVFIEGDNKNEPVEDFSISLSNAQNATISNAVSVVTITDEDILPVLTIQDITSFENQNQKAAFIATLDNQVNSFISFDYSTVDGTALQVEDYIASSGTITFNPGETYKVFFVDIVNDNTLEASEEFTLALTNAVGLTLPSTNPSCVIDDNPDEPSSPNSLFISDAKAIEGASGNSAMQFTVSLSKVNPLTPTTVLVTTEYSAGGGIQGSAIENIDYVPVTDYSITIPANELSTTFDIEIKGDAIFEYDEAFNVTIHDAESNMTPVAITDPYGLAMIINDDTAPEVSISPISGNLIEGTPASGSNDVLTTVGYVNISDKLEKPVSVKVVVSSISAINNVDYKENYVDITFSEEDIAANILQKPIKLNIISDNVSEVDIKTAELILSSAKNANVSTSNTAIFTIEDDDVVSLSLLEEVFDEPKALESSQLFINVDVDGGFSNKITFDINTIDATAIANQDYIAISETITINDMSELVNGKIQIPITILADQLADGDKYFSVQISNIQGGGISSDIANIAILDTDAPLVSITSIVSETIEGVSAPFEVEVTLSNPALEKTTIYFSDNGTASPNTDYVIVYPDPFEGFVEIPAGQTTGILKISTISDYEKENLETIALSVASVSGGNGAREDGTQEVSVNMIDSSPMPEISLVVSTDQLREDNSWILEAKVVISNPVKRDLIVDLITNPSSSATELEDYEFNSKELIIYADNTESNTIRIRGLSDQLVEPIEFIKLNISPRPETMLIVNTDQVKTIQIINSDSMPFAKNAEVRGTEDIPYEFKKEDIPLEGIPYPRYLSAIKITVPTDKRNGLLTFNGVEVVGGEEILVDDLSKLVFTPKENKNGKGMASFYYLVKDNKGFIQDDRYSKIMSLTFAAQEDTPTANDNVFTTNEGQPIITYAADIKDGDNSILFSEIITNPSNGVIASTSDNVSFKYIPNDYFSGTDFYTYRIYDGVGYSSEVTVTITVNPINNAPVIEDYFSKIEQETTFEGSLVATDHDSDQLTFSLLSYTQSGAEVLISPSGVFTYQAKEGYLGLDSFKVGVSDNNGGFVESVVNIDVVLKNMAPVVQEIIDVNLDMGIATQINMADYISDVNGDNLFDIVIFVPTANGRLSWDKENNILTYFPNENFFGTDKLIFYVKDEQGAISNKSTINYVVNDTRVDLDIAVDGVNIATALDEEFKIILKVTNVNQGNITANAISTINIPNDFTFVRLDENLGSAKYNHSQGVIEWTIGDILNNHQASLEITLKANEGGKFNIMAQVSDTSHQEFNIDNNSIFFQKEILGFNFTNAITPNGNGKNDAWVIYGLDEMKADLTIISPKGNTVYKSSNYQNDWTADGLPEGTYFYIVNIVATDGQKYSKKGYITVIK